MAVTKAATKKMIVRTPVTKDGEKLAYDENRQPIFNETVVEDNPHSRRAFESLNSRLPEELRHEFVELDENGKPVEKVKAKAKSKPNDAE